jgi:hypothetical protein
VASFVCPHCGKYTAVQKREGGGVVVAADLHAMGKTASSPK